MKNVLVTLGLVVALFATACKSDSSDNNNPTNPQTSATNSFTANGGGYSNTVFKGFNVDSAGVATVEGSSGLVVFSGLTGKNNESFALTLMASAPPAMAQINAQPKRTSTVRPMNEGAARVLPISTRAGASQRLTLSLDKAAVVQLDADARDVLVSNPEMVDAVVRTPRRIFLLATKVGQTNAFFFDAEGRQILALDIRVERDVGDLGTLMRMSLPNSAITVQSLHDEPDERQWWWSRTPVERLAAVEAMRQVIYGRTAAAGRLQRVLDVVERPRR